MRALILVAALAACSPQPATQAEAPATPAAETAATPTAPSALEQMPTWETARAAGVDFRAVGQEPGWIVDIYTQDRIREFESEEAALEKVLRRKSRR